MDGAYRCAGCGIGAVRCKSKRADAGMLVGFRGASEGSMAWKGLVPQRASAVVPRSRMRGGRATTSTRCQRWMFLQAAPRHPY